MRGKNVFENLVLLYAVSGLFLEIGLVLSIGSSELGPTKFLGYILGFYCVLHVKQVPQRIRKVWLGLIICYILPLILLFLFPSTVFVAQGEITWDVILMDGESPVHPTVDGGVLKMTFSMVLNTFIVVHIFTTYTSQMYLRLLNRVARISVFLLLIALIEFVCKNYLGMNDFWGECKDAFWGVTKFTANGRLRGNFYELVLLTKEASHFAYAMFITAIILISHNIINKGKMVSKSLLLCCFLLLVSTSFSAILFLVALIALMLMYRWYIQKPKTANLEKILAISAFIVILTSAAILINYFSDGFVGKRLAFFYENAEAFFSTDGELNRFLANTDGSTMIRLTSIIQTLIAFCSRPLFGFSLFAVVCHGSTAMFLANVGIVGMFVWIKLYFYSYPSENISRSSKALYAFAILIFLLVNLFNSYLLSPFSGLTPLLISLSFYYLYVTKCNKNYENYKIS